MSITKKITSIILTIIIAVSCFFTGTLNPEAKTTSVPKITYQAHIADDGWLTAVSNGKTAGSTGQSKRMEAIKINLKKFSLSISLIPLRYLSNITTKKLQPQMIAHNP